MFQKLKTQIQKDFGANNQQQNQQQPVQPPAPQQEVVTFSLAKMDQFTHEELQQVIIRYDGQLKKFKTLIQERDTKIQTLEAKVEQVVAEQQSIEQMLELRSEEINGLKQHIQTFMTENTSLKRLVEALEQQTQQSEDIEIQNQQLQQQLDELRNLNADLATGDVEAVYKSKYESLIADHDRLKVDTLSLKQSLDRSNQQLGQIALENEEVELSLQQAETTIQKKDKLIEQLKQRQCQFLDEKQAADDKILALVEQVKRNEHVNKQIGKSNDTVLTEHSERIRGKDLVIQDLNNQIKQCNGKINGMNEKEIYYKRQIEQLQKSVYELQQEKQKQAAFLAKQSQEKSQTESNPSEYNAGQNDIYQLMNRLRDIQETSTPTQSSSAGENSVEPELGAEKQENEKSLINELQQLRIDFADLQSEYKILLQQHDESVEEKQKSEIFVESLEQKIKEQGDIVIELERRRSQARKEIKQLLLKTPKVNDQMQQAGILQLRVLKKDLQQLYKDFLTTTDTTSLEKTINEMIFNVHDCISEVELTFTS